MKNLLSFALLASLAMSAPAQGYAQDEVMATARVDSAAQDAFVAGAGATLTVTALNVMSAAMPVALQAVGCCDQGYEIKSAVQAAGCCDQGYVVNSTAATPVPLLALVLLSVLALAWTYTNHFKTLLARWTLAH